MRQLSSAWIQILIALGAILLFAPGLASVHLFDWDEINFAEIAREMLVSGDWSRPQMDFEPFNEKPPLFMWLQAASMSVFGVGEFAARFPNVVCGAITLPLLFRIGLRERDRTFGLLWVATYVGSLLPNLYFRSGIIDPWFNLFTFLGFYAFIRSAREASAWRSTLSGILLGLAVLTKGPAALIIMGLTVVCYWASQRFRSFFSWKQALLLAFAALAVVSLWFGMDLLRHGPDFSVAFFARQVALFNEEDAGHGGFFGYHFVVLLIGCFPASIFALQEFVHRTSGSEEQNDLRRWMVILFCVVLVLFSVVNTKIVHYSSLCYFPLNYLAALQLERIWKNREGFGWTRFAVGILGTFIAIAFIAAAYLGMHPDLVQPFLQRDPFAQANLEALSDVSWNTFLPGVWLLTSLGAAHFLHARDHVRASLLSVLGGSLVSVSLGLAFLIGRVEATTQRASVLFFQQHAGEKCWLMTKGHKSYVPQFYGRVSEAKPDYETLVHGTIDRPVHLCCKVTAVRHVLEMGTFTETGRANGFVFFRRDP
jgi:4-amino-4-deoxy-L-arabinose transferase-like glycosyltransferase